MKRALSCCRIHLAVLVILVGSVLAESATQRPPTLEQSFQIQPGGTVEVDNPSGSVQVQMWDETYVHVKAEKVNPPGQPVYFSDVTFAASETTIVIGCYPTDPQARINLTLYVPRQCQVQMGKSKAGDRTPTTPSSPQPRPDQPLPPVNPGTSGRIAGDRARDVDQSQEGWGPIRKDGDRKGSSEGSMGIGVRIIPPLGTSDDRSPTDRRRTSDRDPFSIFDQDPFFKNDEDPFSVSKPEGRTETGRRSPASDPDSPPLERSAPVLKPNRPPAPTESGTVSPDTSPSPRSSADDAVSLESRLVTLNVSVRDRSGKPLVGLTQSAFQIYEDDVLQQVAFFSPTSAPFNLVLMLDLSGSTREKLEVIKQAAIRFLDTLSSEDRVAVVTFTREVRLISPLTKDRGLLRERIRQIQSANKGTALYEALWQVMTEVLQGTQGQRNAIVLLSDGVDNSISEFYTVPSLVSFDDILYRLEESDVVVYPIYLDTEQEVVYKYLADSPETYALARERLQAMAEVTGGAMFRAKYISDLDETYDQVVAELRTVYSLGYYPTNNRRDGTWRRLRVKIKNKNAVVRTRAGYYAR